MELMKSLVLSAIPTFKEYYPGPGTPLPFNPLNLSFYFAENSAALLLFIVERKYFPDPLIFVLGSYYPGPGLCLIDVNNTKLYLILIKNDTMINCSWTKWIFLCFKSYFRSDLIGSWSWICFFNNRIFFNIDFLVGISGNTKAECSSMRVLFAKITLRLVSSRTWHILCKKDIKIETNLYFCPRKIAFYHNQVMELFTW